MILSPGNKNRRWKQWIALILAVVIVIALGGRLMPDRRLRAVQETEETEDIWGGELDRGVFYGHNPGRIPTEPVPTDEDGNPLESTEETAESEDGVGWSEESLSLPGVHGGETEASGESALYEENAGAEGEGGAAALDLPLNEEQLGDTESVFGEMAASADDGGTAGDVQETAGKSEENAREEESREVIVGDLAEESQGSGEVIVGDLTEESQGSGEVIVGDLTEESRESGEVIVGDVPGESAAEDGSDGETAGNTDPTETPEEEASGETAAPPTHPVQSFEGKTESLAVFVTAPEGALPAGTSMAVEEVRDDATLRTITETAQENSGGTSEVASILAVDITFFDASGEKVEPLQPLIVAVTPLAPQSAEPAAGSAGSPGEGLPTLIHVDDEGNGEVISAMKPSEAVSAVVEAAAGAGAVEPQPSETGAAGGTAEESEGTAVNAGTEGGAAADADADGAAEASGKDTESANSGNPSGVTGEGSDSPEAASASGTLTAPIEPAEAEAKLESAVVFQSERFSVYALVYMITTRITAGGDTYEITVIYDPRAGIPEGAELEVSEIPAGTGEYEAAVENTVRTLSNADGVAAVGDARFFDISIVKDGERIEPAAPVKVEVNYVEALALAEEQKLQVVHFAEDAAEVLDPRVPVGEEITSFDFETSSFSTFAFAAAKYIGSLNGQSFAIVRDNGSNKAAVLSEPARQNNWLKGVFVNVLSDGILTAVTEANGKKEADVPITAWTFEHVRANFYYVRSDDGKYLTLTPSSLTAETEPSEIEVYPLGTAGNVNGTIRLRCARDSRYFINAKGGNPVTNGFQASTSTDSNSTFTLYAAADSKTAPETRAKKVSAAELTGGKSYVIYQRVYNEARNSYENYVVAGDGSLVYAFDDGDYMGFRTDRSTTWYFIAYTDDDGNPTGYYDFFNAASGKYLAPQKSSILSDKPLGLQMSGREAGEFSTSIEGWDATAWAYYGMMADPAERVLQPAAAGAEYLFSFGEATEFETGTLHEIETVDSAAHGISIRMYDFGKRADMNLFNNDSFYPDGGFKPGLLKRVLGADGLPVSVTGKSFSKIYNDTNYRGQANHLFTQSVYDATGYYDYDAFENFAQYDAATGNFTVYEEMGIPTNGAGGSVSSYYRGNFLPYNHLDVSRPGTNTRLYDTLYGWVSLENPVFQDRMYLMKEAVDYFFGTILEANFVQAKDGLDQNAAPIVYEFMGDDDLWVFLDGVLALDIGGVHSSVAGSINFHTGEIDAGGIKTTIRESFKEAGIFPDGTAWKDSLAENYFRGDTFTDYSGHTMKMFYQERGAGASTLKVRFNLPVVERGTFAVEKQLKGTDQTAYANVQFAYQAFLEKDGEDIPLYPGITLDEEGNPVEVGSAAEEMGMRAVQVKNLWDGSETAFFDGVDIGGNTYDHVFYLKPDQDVEFAGIPENVPYYVQEIDVSGAFFDSVMINDADMGGEGGISEDSNITAVSSTKTIRQRQRVLFVNQCSPANLRDLRITKHVENPLDDGAAFEFRILLEGANGRMTPYNRGEYYLVKTEDDGETAEEHYYIYKDGVPVDQGTAPVVCSTSGPYGTIAGIPDGYTVVIKGLLAGTDFFVDEIRNPAGYLMVSKEIEENSCDPADLSDADGKIRLRKDAHVIITNHRYSTIAAEKIWDSGREIGVHGTIYAALYEMADGAEVLVEKGDVLKTETLQTISPPETGALWCLDLPEGDTLERYVVREVTVTEENGEKIITPAAAGDHLPVTGEVLADGSGKVRDHSYEVSYETGREEEISGGEPYVHDRTDTMTNTLRQRLSFIKVDLSDPGKTLAGAEFDLYEVKNGRQEETPLIAGLISGEDGRLAAGEETEFVLGSGVYHLVETKAPAGYLGKTEAVEITVAAEDVRYDEGTNLSASRGGIHRDPDTGVYTLEISNAGGFALPHTGGPGSRRYLRLGLAVLLLSAGALLRSRRRAEHRSIAGDEPMR